MKILAALLLLALPLTASQGAPKLFVDSVYIDGEILVTVEARDKPVNEVIRAIAKQAGLLVSGFEENKRYPSVAIELSQRPLGMVLDFVLGSVGFEYVREGTSLRIHGHERDLEALLNRAQVAYLRATNSFPKSPSAAAARISQGWIAEQKGDMSSALSMYQLVPESYPNSAEVPTAYYRSGRISEELGNWRDAVQNYDKLSETTIPHDFHAAQRLARARCDIALGDPVGAIYKLKTLDLNMPATSDMELAERTLVRAQAHNGQRDYENAIIDLDQIDQLNSPLVTSPQYLRSTAIALEGLGLYGASAQNWLAFSKHAKGADRMSAIEMSIELFLQAEDEVGALFALRFGEDFGPAPKLDLLKQQLYDRLGLNTLQEVPKKNIATRLEEAQAAWNDGEVGVAYGKLEPIIANPVSLSDAQLTELDILWSRCLDQLEGLDQAMAFLRNARTKIQSLENRTRLDLTAASLYEARDMFDEAVDAYGGIFR